MPGKTLTIEEAKELVEKLTPFVGKNIVVINPRTDGFDGGSMEGTLEKVEIEVFATMDYGMGINCFPRTEIRDLGELPECEFYPAGCDECWHTTSGAKPIAVKCPHFPKKERD